METEKLKWSEIDDNWKSLIKSQYKDYYESLHKPDLFASQIKCETWEEWMERQGYDLSA